jgi:hypothetical protein
MYGPSRSSTVFALYPSGARSVMGSGLLWTKTESHPGGMGAGSQNRPRVSTT